MIDYRVKSFLEAAKNLNYSKASSILNLTQPAVSQHIKSLETEYGVKLFSHDGKKTFLTEQGKLFYAAASRMSSDDEQLRIQLSHLENTFLRFGATLTVGEYVMPEILDCMIGENPDLKISMLVENTDMLLEALKFGEIDFAVVEGFFDSRRFVAQKFASVRYVPVAKKGMMDGKAVLDDLFENILIIREKGSGTRDVLERYLAERNKCISDFKGVYEIGNLNAIVKLVEKGLGISFMYEPVVEEGCKNGLLEIIDVKDFNIRHDFSFIWNKNSIFEKRNREIYEMMKFYSHLGL